MFSRTDYDFYVRDGSPSRTRSSYVATATGTGTTNGEVALWRVEDGSIVGKVAHLSPPGWPVGRAAGFLANGSEIAFIDGDSIQIVQPTDPNSRRRLAPASQTQVRAATASSAGRVGGGGVAGMVTLWDASDGRILRTFATSTNPIAQVAFAADGHHLAAVPQSVDQIERRVWLWDADSGATVLDGVGADVDTTIVNHIVFSPDGTRLAVVRGWSGGGKVGGGGGRTQLYDPQTGRLLWAIPATPSPSYWQDSPVFSAFFSPDGSVLTTTAYRCEVATGRILPDMPGYLGETRESLAVSPDGSLVFVALASYANYPELRSRRLDLKRSPGRFC